MMQRWSMIDGCGVRRPMYSLIGLFDMDMDMASSVQCCAVLCPLWCAV